MDPDRRKAPRPLRVLVTGASGLVGRELCGILADRGHQVAALLHRSTALARNDGAAIFTQPHGRNAAPGSVTLLHGDVTLPCLGLPAPLARDLAGSLDLVVHCAATTAFNRPAAEHGRVNVGGTARVLDFVGQDRGPALLHVSTAYVCGDASGRIAESASPSARFVNAYEASKAEAERLVLASGFGRLAIARPSIVVGHSATGAVGAFGNLYQLLRLVAGGQIAALPVPPGASLDLVPIDHVVAGLVAIAERIDTAPGIVHLASGDPVPLAALERAWRAAGLPRPPRFVPPAAFDPADLPPRQRALYRRVVGFYAAYLRPSPLFATANLAALGAGPCPPTDAAFLRRLLAYAAGAGLLPAAHLMSG